MSKLMLAFSAFVAAISVLGNARPASAQQVVELGEGETLTISGFVDATLFNTRGLFSSFGQGQNAEIAACPVLPTPGCTSAQPGVNQGIFDGDVRNTRLNFTFNAPPVLGKWAPRATIEADFFGAFNGAAPIAPFGDEQPQFRVRHAFVDLSNGRTTVRIGQYWAPLFGETAPFIPVSLAHIAFPVGLGASMIGWRFPGVFLFHDLTPTSPLKLQLEGAALKGTGPTTAGNARDSTRNIGHGEASGLPPGRTRPQAGYDFTPHWSVWADYGIDQPDYARFNTETGGTLARQLTHTGSALLRFRAGRYAAGLEYFRNVTRWNTGVTSADQYALSVLYTL